MRMIDKITVRGFC